MPQGSGESGIADEAAGTPAAQVFISYATADSAIAEAVCEALERAGVRCWIAPRDVMPGEIYSANIVRAIDATRLLILLLSQRSADSSHVLREVERAASKRHRVLSFRIDRAPVPDSLEYFLNTSQWLDATVNGVDRTIPKLVEAVKRALAEHAEPTQVAHARSLDATGGQRANRIRIAIASLAAMLVVGAGVWLYASRGERSSGSTVAAEPSMLVNPSGDTRPSVAVLPFGNRSKFEEDAFFVDGIHDDIVHQLSKVSALRVISRTSVERFRDSRLSLQEIARQLGVKAILEGGVQRAGDRVRINVQLIDAASDAHIWADSYDRELVVANMFAIQSEIANAVAIALKSSLTRSEQTRLAAIPTDSLEAWQAFQRGKQAMATRNSAQLVEAERHLRAAITLDPAFALAWAALSDTLWLQVGYAGRPEDEILADSDLAVKRALDLDPNLAEAWASAHHVSESRMEFDRAEEVLRRAIALNPNYATAHHWLSLMLSTRGRTQDALASAERAVALDPFSAMANQNLADTRAQLGQYEAALPAYQRTLEIDPAMPLPYRSIALLFVEGFGRFDKAVPWMIAAVQRDPGNPDTVANLAYLYWELGEDVKAGRWLETTLALDGATAVSNSMASLFYLTHRDLNAARKYALAAAELDPSLLFLVRDDDIRRRDFTAARARYAQAFPELFSPNLAKFTSIYEAYGAIELALVLRNTGESKQAELLLDHSADFIAKDSQVGYLYELARVQMPAVRGDKARTLAELRQSERKGWKVLWRYLRDFDPAFDWLRNEPEFKAIFADIEAEIGRQRSALAARRPDAPLPGVAD